MAYVDIVIRPEYFVKSIIKLLVFFAVPLLYSFLNKELCLRKLFTFPCSPSAMEDSTNSVSFEIHPGIRSFLGYKKGIPFSFLLGLGVYFFIIGAYYSIGSFFDFSNVTVTLKDSIAVNENNFILVAVYISLVNSLLEEFFFRGIAFLTLKDFASRKFSYIFSAAVFAAYHISIMSDYFSTDLFLLLIISLFAAGLLFNRLSEINHNIYTSWMVHMFANFSINTIGFMLFGILQI